MGIRALIVGWDGATWDIAQPLLEQGRLPNLARLMTDGVHATLRSCTPISSPILWTTIATGKVPEKHGIIRFVSTAKELRTRRIWDILASPERPIGLFGWLVTWPPPQLPGFVIPSLFDRSVDTHPPDLRFVREMESSLQANWAKRVSLTLKALRYGLRPVTLARIVKYFVETWMGSLEEGEHVIRQRALKLDIQSDLYVNLVRRYKPWFTSFYLNQIDAFSHRFWRYLEPEHFPPLPPEEIEKYRHAIPKAYEMADWALGRLLRLVDEDTLICVLSDHGFESSQRAQEGMREFTGELRGNEILRAFGLDQEMTYVHHRQFLVLSFNRQVSAKRRQESVGLLQEAYIPEIDLPMFKVEEDSIGSLTVKLEGWRVFEERDLGQLTVVWPGGQCRFTELVRPDYDLKRSGAHQLDGILVLKGPGIAPRSEPLSEASILDVTPTLLALLGFPVGEDMDGQVLREAIDPAYLESHPLRTVGSHDVGLSVQEPTEEEDQVPQEVLRRLRSLGYID